MKVKKKIQATDESRIIDETDRLNKLQMRSQLSKAKSNKDEKDKKLSNSIRWDFDPFPQSEMVILKHCHRKV